MHGTRRRYHVAMKLLAINHKYDVLKTKIYDPADEWYEQKQTHH